MIDNEFYKELGERWFTSRGDAIALLRLENEAKLPWIVEQIRAYHGAEKCRVLDVGCGGGFLTLELAKLGYQCTGLDVDSSVMSAGRERDLGRKIQWVVGQAESLPFADASFDVICVMDVLEHVPQSFPVLREAARVLAPGGTLLLHTFNRTWLAWLFAVKALDWFIKDSPTHVHDWQLFIPPARLRLELKSVGLAERECRGIGPRIFSSAFARLLLTRKVPDDFQFQLTSSLKVGYLSASLKMFQVPK